MGTLAITPNRTPQSYTEVCMSRFVKADKPLSAQNAAHNAKLNVEVEHIAYDSTAEAIEAAGGEQKFLEFINSQVATEAKNAGRAYLRTAPATETPDAIKAKSAELTKGWSLASTERGPSKAKLLTAAADLAAKQRAGTLTPEELENFAKMFAA